MKTIAFDIRHETVDDEKLVMKDDKTYSAIVRFSYNRCCEGHSMTEIYKKSCELFNNFPTHLVTSANREAKSIFSKMKNKDNPQKLRFGDVNRRKKLLITHEEFQKSRLRGIFSEGETCGYKGNRYFTIDVENKQIIYKRSKRQHIKLSILEKLSRKRKAILSSIQLAMLSKECPISFRIKNGKVFISYDETIIEKKRRLQDLKQDRILGIDLNPNFIGLSILKFDIKRNFQILHKEVFDVSQLQAHGSKNKVRFELQQIDNEIIKLCKHFKCSKLAVEDLAFKTTSKEKSKRQKNFNRLCKNKWRRGQIISHLKTLCSSYGIQLVEVNCAYSSIVGNLMYGSNTTPDMVAASIEIARRAYKKFEKGWFYPCFDTEKIQKRIQNLQKKEISCKSMSWKELFLEIKELGNKWFRFQLNENDAVFRKYHCKAMYKVNIFI